MISGPRKFPRTPRYPPLDGPRALDVGLFPFTVLKNVPRGSIVRWLSGVAMADCEVDEGAVVRAVPRYMLHCGCANRAELPLADSDHFDVTRDSGDHLGVGHGRSPLRRHSRGAARNGVHAGGAARWGCTSQVDEPTMGTNRGLHGFGSLP